MEKRTKKYDEKYQRILSCAAEVLAEDGYDKASIRQIANAADVSLSGLYYYCKSKEELLFNIQYQTFDSIIEHIKTQVKNIEDPKEQLKAVIKNHLQYFIKKLPELKVCAKEITCLNGEYFKEIELMRREYFDLVVEILDRINKQGGQNGKDVKVSAMALFGMLNWIFMWIRPGSRLSHKQLVDHFFNIFLYGFTGGEIGV